MSQEQVNHPSHYGGEDNPYEAIKVVEAWQLGFCLGNVVKYISRAGKKDSRKVLEDLKKSRWYLDREIGNLEQAEKEKAGAWDVKEIAEGLIYPYEGSPKNPVFKNGGIVYCSDFNQHSKSTPPILTTQDPAEKPEAGATNRLKPVEDKAEVKVGCVLSAGVKKWLEDAYDEPAKAEIFDNQSWDRFDRDKFKSRPDEDTYDEPVKPETLEDEAFTLKFRNRHGAY